MRKILKATTLVFAFLFFSPLKVFAEEIQIEISKPEQVKFVDIGKLISNLVAVILIVAALAFFFMFILGGVQWMLSGGDKAGTEAARGRITAALIGLLIVFAAWSVMILVEKFFGITILRGPFTLPSPTGGGPLPSP